MTSEAALAVRRRLRDEYEFYAPRALKIRTKAGVIVPLTFNEAQRRLSEVVEEQMATTGRVRVIILKARQMGLSTYVGGRLFFKVSQRKGRKAIVVTHKSDSTRALFDMTRRFHRECPQALQPSTKYSSRRELTFDRLDSGFMVATAGGDDIGRGETITEAHLSELAFWAPSSAQENFSGLMDAIPNTPGTEVYIESTANGMSGLFFDQWRQAVNGESGFIAVFLPWFIEPGYREDVSTNFERTPEEERLVAEFGLDNEQLMFRRRKIAEKGVDLFKQEYPSTAEEAFLTTGRPVFNPDYVRGQSDRAKARFGVPGVDANGIIEWEAPSRLALEGNKWQPNSLGELKVYHELDPAESYYIGADVGAGVKRDWSVAQVMDTRRRQVATWRGQIEPAMFAHTLVKLGMHYNNAFLAVENNNHGILVCDKIYNDHLYTNFYIDKTVDQITERERVVLGFNTNVKTKPMIIGELREAIREGSVEINDCTTIDEMRTYVVNEEGKMTAEPGCHDDTVMALAIANHVTEDHFEPVEVLDGWYLQVE